MLFEDYFNDEPWMKDSRCATDMNFRDSGLSFKEWQAQHRETDFFGDKGPYVEEAKRYCDECPVRIQCLGYANVNQIDWEIWGGLTNRERRALVKKSRRLVAELLAQMPELSQDDIFPTAS